MSGQQFERLIRLEDEELDSDEHNQLSDKDSCRVPMISNGTEGADNLGDIYSKTKHKTQVSSTITSNLSGLNFTINGRHIQMSPEQLKYLSIITLTVQNAALNLTMRAARTQQEQFSTPVAVTMAEFLKLITCLCLIWYEETTVERTVKAIKTNIIVNYVDTLKVAVPSFIYYIQNNLLYIGSTHLDAATSQVTYQLKILTTAIFSVVMLNKKLSKIQWLSLLILFAGVALIETVAVGNHSTSSSGDTETTLPMDPEVVEEASEQHSQKRKERPMLGFIAILIACCLSGFAGVYFEKILKNTAHISLWIRNIQLAVVAIPIGLIQMLVIDNEHIFTKGAFHGFTPLAWLCIILQAQGGLLVAVVVKFANNILKGFATSMAIVISTVASMFLFDFNLTPVFVFGASLVISSVIMYNKQ